MSPNLSPAQIKSRISFRLLSTKVAVCWLVIGLVAIRFCGNASAQSTGEQRGLTAVYIRYANDYFKATDYYFTQGVYLHFFWQGWEAYAAQDGYTPTSIADPNVRRGDRPYAGTLYGGLRRTVRLASRSELRLSAHLGVIGPIARGGEQQAYIHRKIGDEEPMGWRHQIANDVLIGLDGRFRQRLIERRWLQLAIDGEAQVSSYKTRLSTEAIVYLGWPNLRLELLPAVVVPLFDATLQGGAFSNDSPYVIPTSNLHRGVYRIEVGITGRLGATTLRFAHVYLGKEFETGRPHAWGVLTLGWTGRPREAYAMVP